MIELRTPDQSEKFAALAREQPAQEFPDPPLRKKLPAFGRVLLQARRQGQHPQEVTVVYGEHWRGVPVPKVCVTPLDYQPGKFDWRVIAGVKVILIDLGKGLSDFNIEANQFGFFYSLIAELVAMDAYVVVRYPERGQWAEQEADSLAFVCRWARKWPSWWSDDLDRRQKAAFFGYMDDMERKIRRKLERGQEQ